MIIVTTSTTTGSDTKPSYTITIDYNKGVLTKLEMPSEVAMKEVAEEIREAYYRGHADGREDSSSHLPTPTPEGSKQIIGGAPEESHPMEALVDITIKTSPNNESTEAPCWFVIDPGKHLSYSDYRNVNLLADLVQGPFFSRDEAEKFLCGNKHNLSGKAVVYCKATPYGSYYNKAWRSIFYEWPTLFKDPSYPEKY